ncbi:Os11g0702600, partial [Oryza sativa Japonica Group]
WGSTAEARGARNPADDGEPVALEPDKLCYLGADAVLAGVDSEAELDVGLDGVVAVVQEVVGAVAVRPGEQGVGGDDAGAGEQGGGDGRGLDLATVRSLNGVRVADEILRLVPDAATFHTTLRCVKESTSCSEDSTAPCRRIIRRRLVASKELRRQREREDISASAASTPRISRRRGRRGRSGGEDIDRPAPHPTNASASVRFVLGGDAAVETRDSKLGGGRRARLRMGSGGADDSAPLGLIVVGGSGRGRRSPLIGDGGHGHRATVRGGGVAPPASRRSSTITDRTRGTRRPASSRRPEPARRHRGAAVAGCTTLRPRAPPPVREQRARGRKERERGEKERGC